MLARVAIPGYDDARRKAIFVVVAGALAVVVGSLNLMFLGLMGVHKTGPHPTPTPNITFSGYQVSVFYATDRKKIQTAQQGGVVYGVSSSPDLAYGICEVHIPVSHRKGELEDVSEWVFFPDHEKSLEVRRTEEMPDLQFFNKLNDVVHTKKELLVFVHGYNVSFIDAARRTAQLAFDLEYPAIPVMYSWPSQASKIGYSADEASARYAAFHLEKFLGQLSQLSGANAIHIVAHSMGNRALLEALTAMAAKQKHAQKPRFQQIVLAAPDIDARVFGELAKRFPSTADHFTVYSNMQDKALALSALLHFSAAQGSISMGYKDIDIIDASQIPGDWLDHSTFATSRVLLTDINSVLRGIVPAGKRFGMRQAPDGHFYISP